MYICTFYWIKLRSTKAIVLGIYRELTDRKGLESILQSQLTKPNRSK